MQGNITASLAVRLKNSNLNLNVFIKTFKMLENRTENNDLKKFTFEISYKSLILPSQLKKFTETLTVVSSF